MRRLPAVAAAGVIALALAACGSSTGSPSASGSQLASGKTFTAVLATDPGNLDPDFTSLSVTGEVDSFLYDSLLNVSQTGKLISGLADKWTGNTTKATFTLRKGITCSDGTPLTASDVAANINFVGNPSNASSRISVYVPADATATANNAAGTVTVTSPSPDAFLTENVGGLPIVCAKGMANRSLLKEGAEGTGPFTLTQVTPDDQYTLTARKGYNWGPGNWTADPAGFPAKIVFKIVPNMTTAANLLLADSVNLVSVTGPDVQRLKAKHLFERDVIANLGELWFNEKAGTPTADLAVRKALTEAVDLPQLGQVVAPSGQGTPATGLVSPAYTPCRGNTVSGNLPAHNMTSAEAALTAAGWKVGAGGIRAKGGTKLAMTVIYDSALGPAMEAGAELLQKDWSSIGVQVTLSSLTDTEISGVIFSPAGNWNAGFIPLNVTLPTQLEAFFSGPTPPNGTNFAYVDNSAYNADVKAASSIAGTGGCSDWNAAEKVLLQQADIVPFVDSVVPAFAQGATFELSQGSIVPSSIRMLG
jgi:peptide/nickel transport system substrate-binding protein